MNRPFPAGAAGSRPSAPPLAARSSRGRRGRRSATAEPGHALPFQAIPLPPRTDFGAPAVGAFFDAHLGALTASGRVAGAVVAVVQDGALLFQRGYGHADRERGLRADPQRSRFRVASISKLITWTALMQLVERGLLGLDDEVNAHLDSFRIPATFAEPVRIRHLLTHTAGFETRMFGSYLKPPEAAGTAAADTAGDLAKLLARHLPARVRPPARELCGPEVREARYSDWGAVLAGHLVALKSGQAFEDYVQAQIFEPCGMSHSSFRADPQQPDLACGYEYHAGLLRPRGFEDLSPIGPAASLSSSAADMAQFMIAQLDLGLCAGGARILQPETARRMQQRQLDPHPALNGFGYGFFETWINGLRSIGHAGKSVYFHSELLLVPERRIGLFLSCNSLPPGTGLLETCLRHFFPARLPALRPPADFHRRAAQYQGSYTSNRRCHRRSEALFSLLIDTEEVRATANDTLLYKGVQWVEVQPDLFRRLDGDQTIGFARDARGRVSHLLGPIAVYARHRLDPHERLVFQAGALVANLQSFWRTLQQPRVFGAALLAVLLSFVLLLLSPLLLLSADPALPSARWLPLAIGATNLLILAGLVHTASLLQFDFQRVLERVPRALQASCALSLLSLVLSLAAAACALRAWSEGLWSLTARIGYSLLVAIALLFLAWLRRWNLLGRRP